MWGWRRERGGRQIFWCGHDWMERSHSWRKLKILTPVFVFPPFSPLASLNRSILNTAGCLGHGLFLCMLCVHAAAQCPWQKGSDPNWSPWAPRVDVRDVLLWCADSRSGRNHLYQAESAACFFAVESLGPAFLTVHSLGQYKNEKRLPFPPSHSKASSAKQWALQ